MKDAWPGETTCAYATSLPGCNHCDDTITIRLCPATTHMLLPMFLVLLVFLHALTTQLPMHVLSTQPRSYCGIYYSGLCVLCKCVTRTRHVLYVTLSIYLVVKSHLVNGNVLRWRNRRIPHHDVPMPHPKIRDKLQKQPYTFDYHSYIRNQVGTRTHQAVLTTMATKSV